MSKVVRSAACWQPVRCKEWHLLQDGANGVQVVADEAHQRVDITIDGKPFTSYVWPSLVEEAGALSADRA